MKDFYMTSKTITVTALLAMTFLMTSMHISGMERTLTLPDLPHEMVIPIICNGKFLEDTVKTTLALSTTCKHFNELISPAMVGKFCKNYNIAEKNKVMKKLLQSMNDITYWNKRRAAFLLVYAGADNAVCSRDSLLQRAIYRKDKEMIAALFENNANPNQQGLYEDPDWFVIKNVDILEMFIDRVDVNAEGYHEPNVLWYTILHHCSPELIEFYLTHNVDAKKRKTLTGDCVLHKLVCCGWSYSVSSVDYVRIGKLLLKAAPELINATNENGDTPLSSACKRLDRDHVMSYEKDTLTAIISLFEKHGGKIRQ